VRRSVHSMPDTDVNSVQLLNSAEVSTVICCVADTTNNDAMSKLDSLR